MHGLGTIVNVAAIVVGGLAGLLGGRRIPERAPKEKQGTEAQRKYNHDQAAKKVVRLVNANFRYGDLFTHLTWDDGHMPDSLDEVQRQIRNYIARIRYWRRRHGYDELRYLYAVECRVRRRGRYAGQYKWHVHLFMSRAARPRTCGDMGA